VPWKPHASLAGSEAEDIESRKQSEIRGQRGVGQPMRNGVARPLGAADAAFDSALRLLPGGLAATPVPVALFVGPEHLLAYLNESGRAVFGPRPLSEPATHAFPEFVAYDVTAALERAVATGTSVTVPDVPVRDAGPDPRQLRMTLVCTPVPDPDGAGRAGGVLVLCFDVTERVSAAEQLRAAERRHRYAAVTLQRSLLPQRLVQPEDVRIAACYLPGAEAGARVGDEAVNGSPLTRAAHPTPTRPGIQVGGDWYDVIPLGAGRTGLVIGDVMGRGLHAAAVMGQLRAALRAYAAQNLPPGDVLMHLDRHTADLDGGYLATVMYAVHDPADGVLSYARAGHLPALLRQPDGEVRLLDGAGGPPLGTGEWTWQEATVAMPDDSYLVMFTDGLIERRDADIDVSVGGLCDLLRTAPVPGTRRTGAAFGAPVSPLAGRHAGPVDVVRDHLLGGVSLPAGHVDDVALLVMHVPLWTGQRAELFRSAAVDLVGGPEIAAHARAFASGVLASWHIDEELCDTAVLAVSELVANAVTHGLPPIRLRLRRTDRSLVIDVCDGDDHLPRRRRAMDLDEDGRGIDIVAALTNNWGSRLTLDGKCVWCEFRLPV
jgi:PAS domain-containing protein